MKIVEDNLETESFNVQALQREMGMSQPVFIEKSKVLLANQVLNSFVIFD
jgi:hypothetical protein